MNLLLLRMILSSDKKGLSFWKVPIRITFMKEETKYERCFTSKRKTRKFQKKNVEETICFCLQYRFISGSSLNWRYEGSLQIDTVCAQSRDIKTGIYLFLSKLTEIDILKGICHFLGIFILWTKKGCWLWIS